MLLILDERVVKKSGTLAFNQYLQVLRPIFWDQHSTMTKCTYDLRPTGDNNLMVNNNPPRES